MYAEKIKENEGILARELEAGRQKMQESLAEEARQCREKLELDLRENTLLLQSLGYIVKQDKTLAKAWRPVLPVDEGTVPGSGRETSNYCGTNLIAKAIEINKAMNELGHHVSTYTVLSYLLGLLSNQLIILAGDPGSGKSSFIQKFAMATKSEFISIPVQPGWMDREDLLGFYNPLENIYMPTVFLEHLVDYCKMASQNPEKMYFICLDEMNLSQVEYYFADFLSELQNERRIKLYSQDIHNKMFHEHYSNVRWFNQRFTCSGYDEFLQIAQREDVTFYNRTKAVEAMLEKYKSSIYIPQNVKFVGTLNHDETTKTLSPKVLDRACIIKIDTENEKKLCAQEPSLSAKAENEAFDMASGTTGGVVDGDGIYQQLATKMENYNVSVGYRTRKSILNLAEKMPIGYELYIKDFVVASMILPKLNMPHDDVDKTMPDTVGELCQGLTAAELLWNAMRKYFDEDEDMPLTFWRKN